MSLRICMEKQRYRIVKITLKKKNKFGTLTLPDSSFTAKLNHDGVVLAKEKTEKRKEIERPVIDPIYSELIFQPRYQSNFMRQRKTLQQILKWMNI